MEHKNSYINAIADPSVKIFAEHICIGLLSLHKMIRLTVKLLYLIPVLSHIYYEFAQVYCSFL